MTVLVLGFSVTAETLGFVEKVENLIQTKDMRL